MVKTFMIAKGHFQTVLILLKSFTIEIFQLENVFFYIARILQEIDWYHYQGASPAPMYIVWHQTLMKTLTV